MKTITKSGAQGDVLFRRIDKMPLGAQGAELFPGDPKKVVAHSETGHHHVIDDNGVIMFENPTDPLICYLRQESADHMDVVHHRDHDTHELMRLVAPVGSVWEVRRPREYTVFGGSRAIVD